MCWTFGTFCASRAPFFLFRWVQCQPAFDPVSFGGDAAIVEVGGYVKLQAKDTSGFESELRWKFEQRREFL